jgi:hypothetical protein
MRNFKAAIGTLILGLAALALIPIAQAQVPSNHLGGYDPYQNAYLPGTTAQYMNVNAWDFTGCFVPGSQVTVSIASPAVISVPNTCIAGQQVFFNSTGALPTGLTAGTTYFVIAAGLSASGFEVSTSAGGAAVNTSGTQSGIQYANSNYANATTAFTAAIVTGPLPPQTTVPIHCSLIWQTGNTSATIQLGVSTNNAASSAVVMSTMHFGAAGATLADLYTLVPASSSFATPTAISAATTATAANTSYRADVDILLTSTTLPSTVSINALSSSGTIAVALMPGSKCVAGQ